MEKQYIISREEYLTAREAFRARANDKEERKSLTAGDFLLYSILKGQDWRKQFVPCTSAKKLANGRQKWQGLNCAISELRWQSLKYTVFGDLSEHKNAITTRIDLIKKEAENE